jgi:hypothetical protein
MYPGGCPKNTQMKTQGFDWPAGGSLPLVVHRTDTKEETKAGALPTGRGALMGRASDFIPVALAAANGIERAQAQPPQRLAFYPARCSHC